MDSVALETCKRLRTLGARDEDVLVTVQPTCPFVRAKTISDCVERLDEDTRTVLTVADDRHLRWTIAADGRPVPMYAARVNRQRQEPVYRETGGVIATYLGDVLKTGSRIQQGHVDVVEVDKREAIDIDDYPDFLVAQHFAQRRKALIRADGSHALGVGHIYRALALATELFAYSLEIVTRSDGDFALGHRLLAGHSFPLRAIDADDAFFEIAAQVQPDVVFLDILNTETATIETLRRSARKIVTFEDLGEGAGGADLVVNDLYLSEQWPGNVLSGVENALLSNAFEHVPPRRGAKERVERLLLVFGGTDPSNLTERALAAAAVAGFKDEVTVVLGPGRADRPVSLADYGLNGEVLHSVSDMAHLMSSADLAISSAGRTVTELMTMGVPTLVLCQNRRELLHTHASMPYGVMNLGLGQLVDTETLGNTLGYLLGDVDLRRRMNALMLNATADRRNGAIVRRIEARLGLD